MGPYDDAARYSVEADPRAVIQRLLAQTGVDLSFRGWFPQRTPPVPAGTERLPDMVAILADSATPPQTWLLVLEFQPRPEAAKLAVALEESGILQSRARITDVPPGEHLATSALIHLTGRPERTEIDARLGAYGNYHRPLPWDIAFDVAETVLDQVEAGALSWGSFSGWH